MLELPVAAHAAPSMTALFASSTSETAASIASETASRTLIELGAVFLGLALIARLAQRVGLSPIPFYLLAGLVLRDGSVFDLTVTDDFIQVGAQIGIVLLLLLLGLEYEPDELISTLRASSRAGALDVVLNFLPGVAFGLLLGWSVLASVFLGGVTYVSSSGVIAKVLGDLGRLANRETPSILAILVMEDLAMAVYLPIVGGLALGGTPLAVALSVVAAMVAVGVILYVAVHHGTALGRLVFSRSDEVLLFTIFGLGLLVAGGAERLDISAAVGAFLVGLAISGPAGRNAATLLAPLRDLFAAAFFIFFTFQIDPGAIVAELPIAIALAVVTGATKVFTGWWTAKQAGVATRGRFRAGTTLIARGEFSIVIAGVAVAGTVEPDLAAVATAYVLVLAVVGPVLTRFSDPLVNRFRSHVA